MNSNRRLPGWLVGTLVGGAFLSFALLEWCRPLRRSAEPKLRRSARNLVLVGLSAASIQVAEAPLAIPLSQWVQRSRRGLL